MGKSRPAGARQAPNVARCFARPPRLQRLTQPRSARRVVVSPRISKDAPNHVGGETASGEKSRLPSALLQVTRGASESARMNSASAVQLGSDKRLVRFLAQLGAMLSQLVPDSKIACAADLPEGPSEQSKERVTPVITITTRRPTGFAAPIM